MDNQSVITLLQKHFSATASEAETATLMRWLATVEARDFDEVIESFPNEYAGVKEVSPAFASKLEARIDAIEREEENEVEVIAPVHRIHFLRTAWFRYAAAILIILGIGSYLYINIQKEKPSVTQTSPVPVQNDVAPGGNRAMLTLSDGRTITLDSAKNGELAREANATISKTGDGKIVYDATTKLADKILYNTMATPRGGQYQLTLPDGSQVWLNAESSITYPTAFSTNLRQVTITGEAYFEVAKDKTKKFIVNVNNKANVEVLGTHFNVNAYKEEPTINTTLLEGAVRLTENAVHTSLILKPGQQGQLASNKLSLAVNPDVEQVMAWKNGAFSFEKIQLATALREIARWYDVEVIYPNGVPQMTIGGGMGRDLNLSEVLKVLEGLGVKARLEQKKLYISM